MGLTFTKLLNQFFAKKEMQILILGLDYSGQTTILYKFKHPEFKSVVPTVVYNVETYEYNNISFTFRDIPGSYKIRPLWKNFIIPNTRGLIFVVDSSDRDRVELARDELHGLMNEELLREAVLLVFANKQDLPNAMNAEEMTKKLDLHSLRQSHWHIQSSCATSGEGLYEGLDWFSNILASKE